MAVFDDFRIEQGSDEWWVNRLDRAIRDRNEGRSSSGEKWSSGRLDNRHGTRPGLDLLDAWRRGEPPLPESCRDGWAHVWQRFLRMSRSNYAELVVSSVTDRLVPIGWTTAADGDADGDAEAERVARESELMVVGGDALEDMLALGVGYLLVGSRGDGRPIVTAEDPLQTIVARDLDGPRAGLRITVDEWTGEREYWLYRPGSVRTARVANARVRGQYALGEPQTIPGGSFPLVELPNRRGVGDYERHLDALERINDSMFTRLVLTKLQAHRQRALERPAEEGYEDDDEAGHDDVDPSDFVSGPDALWDLPPGVKLWESGTTDLSPVRAMVQDDVKHLCAVTGTPLIDAIPDAANQSAKGSQLVENKWTARVEDRQRRADRGFAQAMSLAFQVLGDDERAPAHEISTVWGPIERHSLAERSQAAATLSGMWPFERIATDVMGVRPSELPDLRRARMSDVIANQAGPRG